MIESFFLFFIYPSCNFSSHIDAGLALSFERLMMEEWLGFENKKEGTAVQSKRSRSEIPASRCIKDWV